MPSWKAGSRQAERSIELAGPAPKLLDTRALIHMKSGNVEGAVTDLNQAIAQAPTAVMYFHLAQAQQLAKNQQAAVGAFRQATESGFQVGMLPRLERPAFDQMVTAMKKNRERPKSLAVEIATT